MYLNDFRKKKDLLKKRRKLRERLNKALTADTQAGPIEDGGSMFELRKIKNKQVCQPWVEKGGVRLSTNHK